MLQFKDYSLKVGKKNLISNLNIAFPQSTISHLFGNNGVGKSCVAKSCVGILKYSGKIISSSAPVVIGSYSGVPQDLRIIDLYKFLKKKYNKDYIEQLFNLLKLNTLPPSLKIKRMSDGQKQKMKLLAFLASKPEVVILDEFTTALDKSSVLDIYQFLNKYVHNEKVTCMNITHNLSDIEYMAGKYYLLSNETITPVEGKETIINMYVKGGM